MHLSLKGSLKSSLIFTYVKTDQALDLGNLEPFTIPDLSGNANTATLYSGIYVSTNGTTDKAIAANATALGSGNYYLTGKIKPAGTTAKTTMDGSTASNLTGLTAGVWQDFQTATASAITPSSINLGWDGTAFNTTVDNWSDVKLHDASDDSVVAHYKLYDSADASLDGYPALDCVGGFHGAHVGCAGGSGEGVYADVAGISATLDDKMWFDGVDDYVEYSQQNFTSKTINAVFTYDSGADVRVFAIGDNAGGSQLAVTLNCTKNGNSDIVIGLDSLGNLGIDDLGLNHGDLIELSVTTNASKSVISGTVNGVAIGATDADNRSGLGSKTVIGGHDGVSTGRYTGIFFSLEIEGDFLVNNTGATDAAWVDQIGSNNGTVNGNPVTVGQKRETILQTAGEDFNKRMWFDGVNDYVAAQFTDANSGYLEAKILPSTLSSGAIVSRSLTTGASTARMYFGLFEGKPEFRWVDGGGAYWVRADAAISVNVEHTIRVDVVSGVSAQISIDGSSVAQSVVSGAASGVKLLANIGTAFDYIGARWFASGGGAAVLTSPFLGLIRSVKINGTEEYNGDGNTNADWVDQIGSNDGTVNGSPSLYHVAESETTAGQDALGNAITNPRPNERVLNLTTGTGYAEIASDSSFQFTSGGFTLEQWINFGSASTNPEPYLALRSPSFSQSQGRFLVYTGYANSDLKFLLDDGAAKNTSVAAPTEGWHHVMVIVDATEAQMYVDSVAVGTPIAHDNSWAALTENLYIGYDISTDKSTSRQIGETRIYNQALTADEVLKNYNARKGAYGL
jgi:hypothetical protein